MKFNFARWIVFVIGLACPMFAQDSHYRPERQQIPFPTCLTMKGAWEGGSKPCTQQDHEAWLTDIRHWRDERKIRIGYDGSRYDMPESEMDAVEFLSAADDGAGPVLLRSGSRQIHC